jgi:vitamin B12 transporter
LAASYFFDRLGLKLRSSIGTGFLPPYLAARYGGPFQNPNPSIRAERSTGWDVGVDHFFAASRAVVSVTAFRNDLEDLIGFESAPFPALGRAINIGRARTWGLETSGRLVVGRVDARFGYTYLRAEDRDPPSEVERRLIRRPKHMASADLLWSGGRVTTGLGITAAFDREDSDFNSFPFRRIDPGTIFDARMSADWRVGRRWSIRGRIENLINERYEEVYGFPALGRRLIIGVSFEG